MPATLYQVACRVNIILRNEPINSVRKVSRATVRNEINIRCRQAALAAQQAPSCLHPFSKHNTKS
jgi:hypothetical protein